jgi:D-glycero-D-manno-heptose 1,7-bisphosphate phosphatase
MDYKLIIFDADGTLTTTKSGKTFRKTADDWQWLPGRLEKLKELDLQGMKLAVATNQGGVAFGYLNPHEIRSELYRMAKEAHCSYVTMCFSHPNATIEMWKEDSSRRKPGPSMLLEAIKVLEAQKSDTLMVGDRPEDEQAAQNAGVAFMWADAFFALGLPIIPIAYGVDEDGAPEDE